VDEGRFTKLGRFEAELLCFAISKTIEKKEEYISRFIKELSTYSEKPKKKGEGINSGCVWELNGLKTLNFYNPEEVARVVKERLHTKYQKHSSKNEKESFLRQIYDFFNLNPTF